MTAEERLQRETGAYAEVEREMAAAETGEFYVCPQHTGTGGYESCCNCGGWEKGDPDYGRECTEAGPQ